MTKKEIRKVIKELLHNNSEKLPQESKTICKKILCSSEYEKADVVLAYMALFDEVDLSDVIQDSLKKGKKVFIPKIIPETNLMDFYQLTQETCAKTGSFGILEPDENWQKLELKKIDENVLILTPGRAFTKDGKRLGRGKGFYDVFLAKLKLCCENLVVAGVCFPCQILQDIETSPHDVQMDFLYSD